MLGHGIFGSPLVSTAANVRKSYVRLGVYLIILSLFKHFFMIASVTGRFQFTTIVLEWNRWAISRHKYKEVSYGRLVALLQVNRKLTEDLLTYWYVGVYWAVGLSTPHYHCCS